MRASRWPPRLGFAAASVNDHFSSELYRTPEPNPCLGGWEHLRHVFRDCRSALAASRQGADVAPPHGVAHAAVPAPWPTDALERAAARRSRKTGAAIPRGNFGLCDPPSRDSAPPIRSA